MSLFDQPLVCVDIETDGMNYSRGHILEIAVIRIEKGEIVDQFSTILDPGIQVPYFITNLTGITTHDLVGKPTFDDIAERLAQIMEGAVFVAHNVRFDYSFIKEEFRRIGLPFTPKMLCTVKLSRALYPFERSHKLSSLIDRHGFHYSSRHRAYDDAHVLWQFLMHVSSEFDLSVIDQVVARQIALPSLPKNLSESIIKELPNAAGVYIFEDETGAPLYVGKSIDIKKRVMSHFTRDSSEFREFKLAQRVHNIRFEITNGELSALLLESKLVKELQPIHNRKLRRRKEFIVAKKGVNKDGYDAIDYYQLSDINPDEYDCILGIYETRTKAKAAALTAVRTFDLCPKLVGIESSLGSCFSYQLRKCHGACIKKEPIRHYNNRLALAYERTTLAHWPYESAITISEAEDYSGESLVIDKWRIIGRLSQGKLINYDEVFDVDAYKILKAFLMRPEKQLKITPLAV